ncbi:hypothetical protein [Soonwooa sp.]|uniref:hypothetical protein n=1 Tax=Soonwooa sp. TaxID=1938592 RepID=UPI0028B19434|nr:hypothetical protein [Soonwooa sp.]
MENWKDLYKELSEKVNQTITGIKWIDLWSNQVNFLTAEHPFQTPALFMSFRTLQTNDMGEKQQEVNLQIDFYLYYETFLDTYHGAYNQNTALEFLDLMEAIHGGFHGTTGDNYSAMRRIGFNPEDTGGAGNLYRITFTCLLQDSSAAKYYEESENVNFEILKENEDESFVIPG